tara:strand:- start:2779 stop:3849 length:1071 start_codon:yes stop_codon:yes gene_type:complete
MTKILITASGSPGFITVKKSLEKCENLQSGYVIHGCDINPSSIGLKLIDKTFTSPKGTSSNYIPCIYDYCVKNKIDLIIPCADEELLPLAKSKHIFEKINCKILVSDENSLKICLDKSRLFDFLCDQGFQKNIVDHDVCNDVESFLQSYERLTNLGHRVCVKPSKTHGSRGFRVIKDQLCKEDFFNKKPNSSEITLQELVKILKSDGTNKFSDLLVMEFLPHDEYSVDCFSRDNEFICVPRTRKTISNGICTSGKTIKKNDLIDLSESMYEKLGLKYNANFQFRYDLSGVPKLLEVNPRFSGTMEHCRASGVNFVEVAIDNIMNFKQKKYNIRWGIEMQRVWTEIFQDEKDIFTLV